MLGVCSCSGIYLKTEGIADPTGELSGSYTVILYGGSYANDKRTLALLVKEGTPYAFEIYKPEFDYQTIKSVPGKVALEKAEKFVSFHRDFRRIQVNRIIDPGGSLVAYEIKPMYHPATGEITDLLDVDYRKIDGKIVVYIRKYDYPQLEPMPFGGGGMFSPK